jgi:hypothetical protein
VDTGEALGVGEGLGLGEGEVFAVAATDGVTAGAAETVTAGAVAVIDGEGVGDGVAVVATFLLLHDVTTNVTHPITASTARAPLSVDMQQRSLLLGSSLVGG